LVIVYALLAFTAFEVTARFCGCADVQRFETYCTAFAEVRARLREFDLVEAFDEVEIAWLLGCSRGGVGTRDLREIHRWGAFIGREHGIARHIDDSDSFLRLLCT